MSIFCCRKLRVVFSKAESTVRVERAQVNTALDASVIVRSMRDAHDHRMIFRVMLRFESTI